MSGVLQTNGRTPLFAASENGHVEAVRALVGAVAAVNKATVCDDFCGWWCWVLREFCGLERGVQMCCFVCAWLLT